MQNPYRRIHNLAERMPRRRRSAEAPSRTEPTDEQSRLWHEELDKYHYNQPYYTLAESLDMFYVTGTTATSEQQAGVRAVITADAHDLAARLMDESLVEVLDIKPKHPENIALENAGAFSLRSLYLLVHAYDITRDGPLEHVITYAFASSPPELSEHLKRAFEHGVSTNEPVMPVYRMLAALQDDALDIRLAAAGKTDKEMAATGAVDAIALED